MTLRWWVGAAATFLVVAGVLVLVLTASDDGEKAADRVPSAWTAGDGRDEPGSAGIAGDREAGSEARAGATVVASAYDGLRKAVRQKIVPLQADPQTALEKAKDAPGLDAFCASLTTDAREQTIAYARELASFEDFEWTCQKAIALMIRNSRVNRGLAHTLKAEVVGVNVKGDEGTATLSHGKGEALTTVPLVKEDGEWRIGAPAGS